MAPSFVTWSDGTFLSNATSCSARAPAGRTAGQVMSAHVYCYLPSATLRATGWRMVANTRTATFQIADFVRVADGTSADDITVSWSGTALVAQVGIALWANGLALAPVDVAGTGAVGNSTSPTAPGVQTTVAACALVCSMCTDDTNTYRPPSGMTQIDAGTAEGVAVAVQAAAGITGSKTWTLGTADSWAAHLWALAPATTIADVNVAGVAVQHSLWRHDGAGAAPVSLAVA